MKWSIVYFVKVKKNSRISKTLCRDLIMKKYNNLIKHDPDNGTWGDCYRVCFAMILGLEPLDVPHFYEQGKNVDEVVKAKLIKDFLSTLGLVEVAIANPVEDYADILQTMAFLSPGVAFILSGESRSGCGHSVVCIDGGIFHDPSGTGIIGPMEDGYYWVTLFSPKPGELPTLKSKSEGTNDADV